MRIIPSLSLAAVAFAFATLATSARADPFSFSTGDVDGRIATASRPSSIGNIEIESADDFVLTDTTRITSASFTGLMVGPDPTLGPIGFEIYRVFPLDSANPPSGNVPTRVNSPSDVALETRSSDASELSFTTIVLDTSFTAANSVISGINQTPNQTTGGEGAVTGQELRFDLTLSDTLLLPAGHYFFIPQVQVSGADFYWLSSVRPIVAPGTPFAPDLQSWIRNANLDPDWLRIGTDIVGGATPPTFNAQFALAGETVAAISEPATGSMLLLGVVAVAVAVRRQSQSAARAA